MTIYSMNNMPYAALGGVMTGDLNERASLNAYRFVAVNAAQFIVVGFTLPLRDKFAGPQHDLQHGWHVVMTIWSVICLVLFLITFFTTRERIQPVKKETSSPFQDFTDLIKNNPWKIMWCWTLVHFAILTFRGGAQYNYFFHYADKASMFDWLSHFGLVAPPLSPGEVPAGFVDKWLGYIVHGDRSNLANSNVASVFFSIIFMLNMATTIIVILLSPPLAKKFGKKSVCAVCFALATIGWLAFYFLSPTNVWGMIGLTELTAIVYAPTIPLTWAIFADVADYSEWEVGRRFTGMVFATIMFALKAGLSLGSAAFLMIMTWFFNYDTKMPDAPEAVHGFRFCVSILTGVLFAICTILLFSLPLSKRMTIQMADELAERRKNPVPITD
jgi:Na+/melibiose symporter-like transporter